MKLDLFKSVILVLLIALVYFMFKLSKTVEANVAENAKIGRFVYGGEGFILDSKTGATYDVTYKGRVTLDTPEIDK